MELPAFANTPHKQIAASFLLEIIKGNINQAYNAYINPNMAHHNAYFPGDAASLQKGMEESHLQTPNKQFIIKHMLEDGDLVAVHAHLLFKEGDPGMAVVHMFRFEDDKVIEMWDLGMPIPKGSPNENGAF